MDTMTDTETRTYSPAELSVLVAMFREVHKWSQETLAEIARITVRTVQRVEAGEPSSLDTRRSLARAFGLDDIDTFNRLQEFTSPEAAERAKAEFDAKFVAVEARRVTGRELVTSVVHSGPFRAIHTGTVGNEPTEVQDLYASVMDYMQDILDVCDVIGHVEALRYGDEIEVMISEMRAHGFEIALGVRDIIVRPGNHRTALSYIVTLPVGTGDRTIAVAKAFQTGF